jgi:hypothetical protein
MSRKLALPRMPAAHFPAFVSLWMIETTQLDAMSKPEHLFRADGAIILK